MLKIVLLEVSVVALMEMNEDGHDFARVHRAWTMSTGRAVGKEPLARGGFVEGGEVIDLAEQFE